MVQDVTERGAETYLEREGDILLVSDCAWDENRNFFCSHSGQLLVLRNAQIDGHHQDRVESRFHATEQAIRCLACVLKAPLRSREGCRDQAPTLFCDVCATLEKFAIITSLALQPKGCGIIHQLSKH